MYDAIHYRANSPARVLDCTSVPKTTLPRDISAVAYKSPFDVTRLAASNVVRSHKLNSPTAPRIGDVIADGPDKGWIYCETEAKEPFLVAPKDSGIMMWLEALEYAAHQNAELPSLRHLDAMHRDRNAGALKGTFNESGRYWSNAQDYYYGAWCQRFSDGRQRGNDMLARLSVRCVRRLSI